MKQSKISAKYFAGYATVAVLAIIVGIIGIIVLASGVNASTRALLLFMTIVAFICAVFAIGYGNYLSQKLSNYVKGLIDIADRIALGDTELALKQEGPQEMEALMAAMGKIIEGNRALAENAAKMARGDLNISVAQRSDKDIVVQSMGQVICSIKAMLSDANMLSDAAVNGRFSVRADTSKHHGCYLEIIEGVNNSLDSTVQRIDWYNCILDSIPFAVSVTDMDMNWTYINKEMEKISGISRNDGLGKHCSGLGTTGCNKDDCSIACLKSGKTKTAFDKDAENYLAYPSYIYDKHNNKIGHVEIIQNNTSDVQMHSFAGKEVDKLIESLRLLSEGNLHLKYEVAEGNEFCVIPKGHYTSLNRNLEKSVLAILGYIGEAKDVLGRIAKGDLNVSITGEFKGEFVELKDSINLIASSLNSTMIDIDNTASQVASGSRRISDSAQALSQSSTEQASSIEELTASMEQIAAQTKLNADNATKANELALYAQSDAERGNDQMVGMLKAMEDINLASSNISKIIKVIDEIAFQTNILALNAAVEAARAGQHGKGFAVVAEEVRNLAARSANAAKETTVLIEGSIKKADDGMKIATDTAGALNQIVDGVAKAASLVGEIATASSEQATGIAQVNKAIMQVSQLTQTYSATSEKSASESEELSKQSEGLKQMLGRFILDKGSSNYNELMELNPEVLKILENLNHNKKHSHNEEFVAPKNNEPSAKIKISLNSNDFGKY